MELFLLEFSSLSLSLLWQFAFPFGNFSKYFQEKVNTWVNRSTCLSLLFSLFSKIFFRARTIRPWDVDKFVNLLSLKYFPNFVREWENQFSHFPTNGGVRLQQCQIFQKQIPKFFSFLSKRMTNAFWEPSVFPLFFLFFFANTCWNDSFQTFFFFWSFTLYVLTYFCFCKTFFSFFLQLPPLFLSRWYSVFTLHFVLYDSQEYTPERLFCQCALYEIRKRKKIIAYWNN